MPANVRRFDGVDFSTIDVVQWTPDQGKLGSGFHCSKNEFTTYWKKDRVAREVKSHISRCWVVTHDGQLGAYVTLLADKLSTRRKLLKSDGVEHRTFPAVKIGLLAADKRASGAGKRLMEFTIWYVASVLSPTLGIRFLTVDAYYDPDTGYDISPFYVKLGFEYAHPKAKLPTRKPYRAMFMDLKLLLDSIEVQSTDLIDAATTP